MKAANRIRSGQTLNLLARMKKKILSLDLVGKLSVNESVSKSSFSRLTSASSRPLSAAGVAAFVAVVAVVMELPEAAEEKEGSAEDVEMELAADVDVVMVPTEEHHADHREPMPEVRPLIPTIRLLFLVWDRNLLTIIQSDLQCCAFPCRI